MPLLVKCQGFMDKYAKRGYLSKMLCGYSDGENLKNFDKGLSDVIQSVTLSLGVMNISMMSSQHQKLDDLADLVRTTGTSTESSQPFGEDSPVVQTIAKCVGVEVGEVVSQIQQSLDKIMKSQDVITSKLDQALELLEGHNTRTSKRAPEDPKAFWDDYFDEKSVAVDLFVPVFEDEFCPDEVTELPEKEREVLIHLLDAYPHDGLVSVVEWKRFCKQCSRGGFGLYDFIVYIVSQQED
mmetsp:Transcript_14764/g.19137  ORF Transcript_14764/g.19137 Transcript_14764/m.19137 type:complete len:239 (-) Transcript_14764:324-1040(-)